MDSPMSYPLPRERKFILAALLVLAAAAWGLLIWQASAMGDGMVMENALTMGLSAPVFVAIWIVMMVAMMFPTAAPMILAFAAIYAGKRQRGQVFVPTWVFVAAYLTVWTFFGVLAYALALGAEQVARNSMWLMEHAPRLGGALLLLAGLYQLSPLKHLCLAKCRTPLQFIIASWRDGRGGAFRMGLAHGAYCLGCCWLLFAILFPLGIMNVALMALLTLLIFVEKSWSFGPYIGRAVAVALIVYGALVILVPGLFLTRL